MSSFRRQGTRTVDGQARLKCGLFYSLILHGKTVHAAVDACLQIPLYRKVAAKAKSLVKKVVKKALGK